MRNKDFQVKVTPYYNWIVVDFERDLNLSTQKAGLACGSVILEDEYEVF